MGAVRRVWFAIALVTGLILLVGEGRGEEKGPRNILCDELADRFSRLANPPQNVKRKLPVGVLPKLTVFPDRGGKVSVERDIALEIVLYLHDKYQCPDDVLIGLLGIDPRR